MLRRRGGAARDARRRGRRARLARAHASSCAARRAAGTRRSARSRAFIVTNAILVQGLFLAFFIGMLSGIVPSFGAARRSVAADAARGVLDGAAAPLQRRQPAARAARAPRSRVGVIALVVLATTLLLSAWSRACGARSSRRASPRQPDRAAQGRDQRRLERAAARGLPGAALSSTASRRAPTASRSCRPSWSCSRSSCARDGGRENVLVRGVEPVALAVHDAVRIVEGRMFEPVAAARRSSGRGVAGRYAGARARRASCEFGRGTWKVVGLFESGGSSFESEVWVDVRELARDAKRPMPYSGLRVRVAPGADLDALVAPHRRRPALGARGAARDRVLRRSRPKSANALYVIVIGLAVLSGIGAIFGATNTLYASVQARTAEIGTLRALGFSRGAILHRVPDRVAADGGLGLRGRRRARGAARDRRSRARSAASASPRSTFTHQRDRRCAWARSTWSGRRALSRWRSA